MLNHPLLTKEQNERYKEFLAYAEEHVTPNDPTWDKEQGVPREAIEKCAEAGYVGGLIPKEFGGSGWDAVTFGLLNEVFGAASSSLCAHFTVQNMVAMPLAKFGTPEQQEKYLKPMARGEMLASFAITEPKTGSDTQALEVAYTPNGDGYLLNGTKRWITYSGIADIFLVFGKCDKTSIAAIVRSNAPGVTVKPIRDMLGFRGVYLSQLDFENVEIAPEDIVGKPGFALSYVAPYGLHYGRISTAWSSCGLLRACVELGSGYATQRRAFGSPIMDHGMIRRLITEMAVNLEASQHLCLAASQAEDNHLPGAIDKTLMAKYFSSRSVVQAASDTIQIMGASGCHEENHAARYYRNAKIMEIIEGTTQIHYLILGKNFARKFGRKKK